VSPSPIEAPEVGSPTAATGLARQVSRLLRRGHGPASTLFVQPDAAWAWPADGGPARRFAQAGDALAAHPGGSVRVVLSGLLTHQLVAPDPSLPLADAQAVMAWARHQVVHYHGAAAQAWAIAPWHHGTQRGAAALHGVDLPALTDAAARHDVRLRAVQPWWTVALHALTRESPTVALAERAELWLIEGLHATRVLCAAGTVLDIEQHWLERADPAALLALLASRAAPAPACWLLGYGLLGDAPMPPSVRCPASLAGEHPAARWLEA
jgi:hypothetical protein